MAARASPRGGKDSEAQNSRCRRARHLRPVSTWSLLAWPVKEKGFKIQQFDIKQSW